MRFHFIELLNFFELAAIAYNGHVADRRMVDEALKEALRSWHTILHEFIEVVKSRRGYNPWKPYCDLVHKWSSGIEDWPPTDG